MDAKPKHFPLRGKHPGVDQFGTRLGQGTLVRIGKFFVKFAREHQSQHRVAEKFQPLVVGQGIFLLVRDGRMRQREAEETFVAELMTETDLEFGKVGHRI